MSDEKTLLDHEERLKKIEAFLFSKKQVSLSSKNEPSKKYDGLSGGIYLLIDEGFLKMPRAQNEIQNELKTNGFHYPLSSIAKLLSVDFMKKKRLLNRIKDGSFYKYVLRK